MSPSSALCPLRVQDRLDDEYTFDFASNHFAIGEEVAACRTAVALFDQSYFGKFFLEGPDAVKALQFICTNNVDKAVGATTYTQMCNARGGVECDLAVHRVAPHTFYVTAGGGSCTRDWKHIHSVLEREGFDCALTDHSAEYALFSVMGPFARDLLYRLVRDGERARECLSNDAFPFATNQEVELLGDDGEFHKLRAIRLTFVGELGWELHVPRLAARAVYKSLMRAGRVAVVRCGVMHWDAV